MNFDKVMYDLAYIYGERETDRQRLRYNTNICMCGNDFFHFFPTGAAAKGQTKKSRLRPHTQVALGLMPYTLVA
jgi:hypothetical protein